MELIEKPLAELPGANKIAELIISSIPEFHFPNKPPLAGLTVIATDDISLCSKVIDIDHKKYDINRHFQFPMIIVQPISGTIQSFRCRDDHSSIFYSDKEHIIFYMKPTTSNYAVDKDRPQSIRYYEALIAIYYSKTQGDKI